MKMVILLTLSGSAALVTGLIILKISGRFSSAGWQDMWSKMIPAFYLISVFAVIGIRYILKKLHIMGKPDEEGHIFLSHKAAGILKYETGIRVNRTFILYAVITSVVVLIMLILFIRKLGEYRNIRRTLMSGDICKNGDILDAETERLKSMIRLKKKVRVCLTDLPTGAFTIGYFRPVIVLQDEVAPERREVILLHELCHIKRRDVLFKFLTMAVVCVHWFNPLVYFLPGIFNRSSELNCDEMVLRYLSPEQKKIYMQEIISQSKMTQENKNIPVRLGGNVNLTKERVVNMMKENGKGNSRVSKCVMMVLTVIMLVVSSLPVCAYEGVTVFEFGGDEECALQQAENISYCDYLFTSDDSFLLEAEYTEIRFDQQFVDEDGNIYEADLNENGRAGCTHVTLTSGTYQKHDKNGSGGCVVRNYAASRCSSCGSVFLGDLISKYEYTKCPH